MPRRLLAKRRSAPWRSCLEWAKRCSSMRWGGTAHDACPWLVSLGLGQELPEGKKGTLLQSIRVMLGSLARVLDDMVANSVPGVTVARFLQDVKAALEETGEQEAH